MQCGIGMAKCFGGIKNILTCELLLTHFNFELDIVASIARKYGIGDVICHTFKDFKIITASHASKRLIAARKNSII